MRIPRLKCYHFTWELLRPRSAWDGGSGVEDLMDVDNVNELWVCDEIFVTSVTNPRDTPSK